MHVRLMMDVLKLSTQPPVAGARQAPGGSAARLASAVRSVSDTPAAKPRDDIARCLLSAQPDLG